MHELAEELNRLIQNEPIVYDLLSEKAKRFYFPKGILAQAAEAALKGGKRNATLGVSTFLGEPMYLQAAQKYFSNLAPKDLYFYAAVAGRPKLRQLWQKKMQQDNPSLSNPSLPFLTSGITQSVALAGQMFLNPGDEVICPHLFWENYSLIFETDLGASLKLFALFQIQTQNGMESYAGFNLAGLKERLQLCSKKVFLIFNFPNNPTGYSLTQTEQDALVFLLKEFAEKGLKIAVLCDDAYYGLFYEQNLAKESLFARIAKLHPNLLAIKADGATKEMFMWGFRIGFLTFGYPAKNPESLYFALEKKLSGLVRTQLSNPSHPGQSVLEKILEQDSFAQDYQHWFQILKSRAKKAQSLLKNPNYKKYFEVYPFNSGYFLCLKINNNQAFLLRQKLLENHAIGTIAFSASDLRIAFSSVEEEDLEGLFDNIYQACIELS